MTRIASKYQEDAFEQEQPSGTVNGSNVTFTLSAAPISSKAISVFLDGLLCKQTTHYSLSGSTITFVTAPATGQSVYAIFRKA